MVASSQRPALKIPTSFGYVYVSFTAASYLSTSCQATRGSAGSFGITTSIEVTTFPAPPSATVVEYQWDMSVPDAANGIAAFQSFVQTNIPPEFGADAYVGSKQSRTLAAV